MSGGLPRDDPLAPNFVAAVGALSMTALLLAVSLLVDPLVPYLAFGPSRAWPSVLLASGAGLLGAAGALALRRRRAGRSARRIAVAIVAALALVACYRVARAFVASGVSLPGEAKAVLVLALIGAAILVSRQPERRARRAIEAVVVTTLAGVMVHPAGLGRQLLAPPATGHGAAGTPGGPAAAGGVRPTTPSGTAGSARGTPVGAVAPGAPRVVVLLLDELDGGLAGRAGFLERSGLASGAVYVAPHATPAGANTIVSVPSMLQGHAFGRIVDARPGRLQGEGGAVWRAGEPSLFTDVLDGGGRVAIRGFYHDYCAIARPSARVASSGSGTQEGDAGGGGSAAVPEAPDCRSIALTHPGDGADVLRALLPLPPMRMRVVTGEDVAWRDLFAQLAAESIDVAARSDADLLWLHVNAPHPPAIVAGAEPVPDASLERAYEGNLAVAAALVSRIRGILRARGDQHVLIVTSDHGLRIRSVWRTLYVDDPGLEALATHADGRVPFIVAFPGEGVRHDDTRPVSTLSLRDLVGGLLRGEVRSPSDVAARMRMPDAGVVAVAQRRKSA